MRYKNSAMVCLVVLLPALLWSSSDETAPVPVRFAEGALHGFLVLSSSGHDVIASGDLRQVGTGKGIESRTVFHFKDGSLSEETVVFSQQKTFSLQTYQLVQRGPAFAEDTEISLDRPSRRYHVKTKDHKEGHEKVSDGSIDLPSDVYNGMIFTITKNLPKATRKTVHLVAFTPEPQLIQLDITPAGGQSVTIDGQAKRATHYVLHPDLGVKFEGPLYMGGPVWRIELASPRT